MAQVRKQYHFRPSPNGFFAWDVRRLIALSEGLPVFDLSLDSIAEIDELWWFQTETDRPTPRAIAGHLRLMMEADSAYPIILCPQGRLMDGMHRVLKSLASGASSINAVQLPDMPEPDHTDIDPADLGG